MGSDWVVAREDAHRQATVLKSGQAVDWDAVYRTIDAETNRASSDDRYIADRDESVTEQALAADRLRRVRSLVF